MREEVKEGGRGRRSCAFKERGLASSKEGREGGRRGSRDRTTVLCVSRKGAPKLMISSREFVIVS